MYSVQEQKHTEAVFSHGVWCFLYVVLCKVVLSWVMLSRFLKYHCFFTFRATVDGCLSSNLTELDGRLLSLKPPKKKTFRNRESSKKFWPGHSWHAVDLWGIKTNVLTNCCHTSVRHRAAVGIMRSCVSGHLTNSNQAYLQTHSRHKTHLPQRYTVEMLDNLSRPGKDLRGSRRVVKWHVSKWRLVCRTEDGSDLQTLTPNFPRTEWTPNCEFPR